MEQITTTAIVTRTADFRDYDRMITLLSPDIGRVDLCLKGCRKPSAKLRAAGQMFCFADFELLKRRQDQYIVTGVSVRDSFFSLSTDIARMQAAGKISALCTLLFDAQEDAQKELFALLLSTVTTLAYLKRVNTQEVALVSVARMLEVCGYRPQLDSCVECGAKIESGGIAFSSALGGALCASCAAGDAAHTSLSAGAVSSLRMALALPNTKLATFHFSPSVQEELRVVLSSFLSHRLEQPITL